MNKDDPLFDPSFKWSLLAPKHWGSWIGIGVLALLSFVPIGPRDRFAAWVARKLYGSKIIRTRKNIALVNLRLCFPEKSETELDELMLKNLTTVCQAMLAYGELKFRSHQYLESRLNLIGEEHVNTLLESKEKNILFLAPHTYCVDWGGQVWSARGTTMCTMYNNTDNPVFEWFIASLRLRYQNDVEENLLFHRSAGAKAIVKAVKKGYPAYYLPDEDFGPDVSVMVPFFATQKATLPALGKMSRLARAKVVPIYTTYNSKTQKYDVYIHPPMENYPTGNDEQDAILMNQEIERLISHDPAQFMWTLKFFKTRPEAGLDIYKDCKKRD